MIQTSIRFQARGVRFTIPLLTLLTPLLGHFLGMSGGMGTLFLSLGLHEGAHLLAARICSVEIREIQLTPFGGSARMENPYGLNAARLFLTSAAGPAANLLLACLCAALVQWNLLGARLLRPLWRQSLLIGLFNLLPALPLDGGRMLFSLLQQKTGEARALKAGLLLGRMLALILLAAAVAGGVKHGVWNLSFLLAAAFLFASVRDEREAFAASRASRLEALLRESDSPRPARIFQLPEHCSAARALSLLRPRESCWFVLTRSGVPTGMIDAQTLLRHILSGGAADAPLRELKRFSFHEASL